MHHGKDIGHMIEFSQIKKKSQNLDLFSRNKKMLLHVHLSNYT